ncbi:MAG: glycosyltransferase family 4 protein [Burkholderiaceae bacterium]
MTAAPLRILHTESSLGWGGQEIRTLTEARGFLDRGHQVKLLTPREARIHDAAARMGIPVEALPIGRKRAGPLLALRGWLARHADDYDVVNTHSSTDSWLAAVALRTLGRGGRAGRGRPGPRLVRTRHVSTPVHETPGTRWLYQTATCHIVTTGEALRERLHRNNGFALETMTSVRTGIDLDRFRPLDQARCRRELGVADRPTLGIVATLRSWKGHDFLLDAWRTVKAAHGDWQLLIVGDGPRRAHLEQRVRDEALADVVFVGNQEDVPPWLNCLDLYALPSYGEEGVPQGIMQAMACGLAVVSTPVGAIEEALQRDRTGLIVPPRDAAALAAAIGRLIDDADLRKRMGAAGHAYAQQQFGIARMLDAMERVFREAVTPR